MLCVSELRGLQEFQAKHPELVVVALTVDGDPAAVEKVTKRHQLSALRVAPAGDLQKTFALSDGIPVTLIIANGRLRVIHAGVLSNPVLTLEADLAAIGNPAAAQGK